MSVRRDSLQSSQTQRVCTKHPQKLASHQLAGKNSHHDAFYCEKCSIMLASQGYNVIKLINISPIPSQRKGSFSSRNSRGSCSQQYSILSNRKHEISTFVQGLQSLNFQITRKIQEIQDYLIKSESSHGRMIQQANRFYKQIEEAIELQKYITYNSILNKRLIDQEKARQTRDLAIQACQEIQSILNDIRYNMDAVQTVDYSIYNTIMGGYHAKTQKLKLIAKQPVHLKSIQKLQIQFPQIPKTLLSISNKISIVVKKQGYQSVHNSIPNSLNNSIQNSLVTTMRPQRPIAQDDYVCMSQQQNEPSRQTINQEMGYDIASDDAGKDQQIIYKPKQIIKSKGNMKQLAFSFDENSNQDNQKQLKIYDDSSELDGCNLMVIKGFEQGKLSKIQERMNSKQVCESRQSLGEYLNISTSRDRYFAQDTQTLLIV